MKRGPKPYEIPSDFCSYYFEQKEKGVFDQFIAQELFISENTLHRWKKQLGISSRKKSC